MKAILWKLYFWIIVINLFLGYLITGFPRLWEIIDVILYIIAGIGLYAYLWKKKVAPKMFWKIFFFIQLVWNIFYFYFLPIPESVGEGIDAPQHVIATISVIFYLPLFAALYFLAFREEIIKNIGEKNTTTKSSQSN